MTEGAAQRKQRCSADFPQAPGDAPGGLSHERKCVMSSLLQWLTRVAASLSDRARSRRPHVSPPHVGLAETGRRRCTRLGGCGQSSGVGPDGGGAPGGDASGSARREGGNIGGRGGGLGGIGVDLSGSGNKEVYALGSDNSVFVNNG